MHWLYTLWYGYVWPSLKGNGPEAVGQTLVYGAIAIIFIPPVRRWLKHENDLVHDKLNHLIHHSKDVPAYVHPEGHRGTHPIGGAPVPRKAGKLGRKPAVYPPQLKGLSFYRKTPLAPGNPTGDVSGAISVWGMLGNDTHGDCGPAATYHVRMMKAMAGGGGETFTTDQVLALYTEYCAQFNGGQDEGVVISQWLNFLYKKGLCLGYGAIDEAEVTAYAQAGHGIIYGVELTDADESDFEADPQIEWGSNSVAPDPNLGHAIALCKWDQASKTFVTWGAEQQANLQWESQCTQERWVVITQEDDNIDLAALQADIESIPGAVVGPTVTPPAPPPPSPPPPPTPPTPPSPVVPPAPPGPAPTPPVPPDPLTLLQKVVDEIEDLLSRLRRLL